MKKKQFWRYNEVTTDTVQTANCTPNWANELTAAAVSGYPGDELPPICFRCFEYGFVFHIAPLKYVLFDTALGLIELKGTPGPWRRYALCSTTCIPAVVCSAVSELTAGCSCGLLIWRQPGFLLLQIVDSSTFSNKVWGISWNIVSLPVRLSRCCWLLCAHTEPKQSRWVDLIVALQCCMSVRRPIVPAPDNINIPEPSTYLFSSSLI